MKASKVDDSSYASFASFRRLRFALFSFPITTPSGCPELNRAVQYIRLSRKFINLARTPVLIPLSIAVYVYFFAELSLKN